MVLEKKQIFCLPFIYDFCFLPSLFWRRLRFYSCFKLFHFLIILFKNFSILIIFTIRKKMIFFYNAKPIPQIIQWFYFQPKCTTFSIRIMMNSNLFFFLLWIFFHIFLNFNSQENEFKFFQLNFEFQFSQNFWIFHFFSFLIQNFFHNFPFFMIIVNICIK